MFDIFTTEGLISFLYSLPALLISLSVHEFFHAYTAYKLGDISQKLRGRLTFYPFSHIDLFGFISIALFGFGWGKPVIVDDSKFKNRRRDNMLVSIAGPLSNLVLAIIFTLIFKIMYETNLFTLYDLNPQVGDSIFTMMYIAFSFNIIFAIFNMIPIPPFDGARLLFYILPPKYEKVMFKISQYSFFIIIFLFVTGLGTKIITPIYNLLMGIISVFILL